MKHNTSVSVFSSGRRVGRQALLFALEGMVECRNPKAGVKMRLEV